MRKILAAWLMWLVTFAPTASWAGRYSVFNQASSLPNVPENTLPVGFDLQSGEASVSYEGNDLTIEQNSAKAVIDWQSFNIGRNASTHFDQQGNADWAALNRIHQESPSQILGQLSADGKIYLVNQNGILFGPESQVNVHSLTASTLNISNENFLANNLSFQAEDYIQNPEVDYVATDSDYGIRNQGIIATEIGGQVFLTGQKVVNQGTISAPAGQIALAAGSKVTLVQAEAGDTQRIPLGDYVEVVENPGEAINDEGALLESNLGLIGMYGGEVTQDGTALAATSPEKTSQIELLAEDQVSTGVNSWTGTPITTSNETFVADADEQQRARVWIGGLSFSEKDTVRRVIHRGTIDAPSGAVEIRAGERVYLEDGSQIDVSGLWVDQSAEDLVFEATLNSLELRDYFAQKGGLLQGETIRFLATAGSSIGDVSGTLNSRELSAAEQNLSGGTINISSGRYDPNGEAVGGVPDIIVREGAELDFSGGGIRYAAGTVEVTGLNTNDTVIDIAEASPWSRFSAVKNIHNYIPAHVAGADAGSLTLIAPRLVLDGTLKGGATVGAYQLYDSADEVDGLLSLLRPQSGTLQLGLEPVTSKDPSIRDAILESVRIADSGPVLGEFSEEEDLNPEQANLISVHKFNEAGLGSLKVHANREFALDEYAQLKLQAGGQLLATARRIVQEGEVQVAGGDVTYSLRENITAYDTTDPRYSDIEGRFHLGKNAIIDVAGERIDNRQASRGVPARQGLLDGGTVTIEDKSAPVNGLVLAEGSRIDVSGGYKWDSKGNLDGGDAGGLSIEGDTLVLDGTLTGLALVGRTGGEINLHASDLTVTADAHASSGDLSADSDLSEAAEGLVLSTEQLTGSGFTQIHLNSVRDLVVESGAHLKPSETRLQTATPAAAGRLTRYAPASGAQAQPLLHAADGRPLPEDLGKTLISLKSGAQIGSVKPVDSIESLPTTRTVVESGSAITAGPTGSIAISGPGVEINGVLEAPAGDISVTASSTSTELGTTALIIGADARIRATGWNGPGIAPAAGLAPTQTALDGGMISLKASAGSLHIDEGAVLDVSAAPVTRTWQRDARYRLQQVASAGNPGQLTLSFFDQAKLNGQLLGQAAWTGGQGGSFTLVNTDLSGSLELDNDNFQHWLDGGFDSLTLRSYGELAFNGTIDAVTARSLVLDTPRLTAGEEADIRLAAPWLRLINTVTVPDASPLTGDGQLTLEGNYLDIVGDVQLSGFASSNLLAHRDLRVSDFDYSASDDAVSYRGWSGQLTTTGDLLLGGRIFPEVPEDFASLFANKISISGDEEAANFSPVFAADFTFDAIGRITTLPGRLASTRPLTSSGGSLTFNASGGIAHYGTAEAPFGTLALNAPVERVLLAEGSLLSIASNGAAGYGTVKDGLWFKDSKNTGARTRSEISESLEKGVTVTGDQVLMAEGAQIDVSGGGALFGYQFQPGVEGSRNPLNGKLIVVADPDLQLPGEAVYLKGVAGVADGVYSIVAEESALTAAAYGKVHEQYSLQAEQMAELAAESAVTAADYAQKATAAASAPAEYDLSAADYAALAEDAELDAQEYTRLAEQYVLMAAQYAKLPAEYAVFKNALVLTDLGTAYQAGGARYTEEGYRIVAGYQTWQGTDIEQKSLSSYAVRNLAAVLKEGNFEIVAAAQGNAGTISLQAPTTVVNGTLSATPGNGLFSGGTLQLSGEKVVLSQSAGALPTGFNFDSTLAAELQNALRIDGAAISGQGFAEIELGDLSITRSVTLEDGSSLQAEQISLSGSEGIYLRSGSTLEALSNRGQGEITLRSPNGEVVLEEDALVHASDALNLATNQLDLQGEFRIDNSTVNLQGDRILFVHGDQAPDEPGLFITEDFWSLFSAIDNIGLESASDVVFRGDFDLTISNLLSFDAARIVGESGNVALSAKTIALGNSGAASSDGSLENIGSLTLNADTIQLVDGNIRTDSFQTIDLIAGREIAVRGNGSLSVDADLTLAANQRQH